MRYRWIAIYAVLVLSIVTTPVAMAANEKIDKQLLTAAENKDIGAVQAALKAGANINIKVDGEYILLHSMVQKGYVDIVKLLVENGADPNARGNKQFTPLHLTACMGNKQMAKILLEIGVDVNALTKEGWTALHYATREGHVGMVRFLIKRNAKIDLRGKGAITPLTIAADDCIDTVKLLLDHGADVDGDNNNHYTPLFASVSSSDNLEIVKHLIDNKANINAQHGLTGWTPLHRAIDKNRFKIAGMLIKRGANINIADHSGDTPLLFAKECIGDNCWNKNTARLVLATTGPGGYVASSDECANDKDRWKATFADAIPKADKKDK